MDTLANPQLEAEYLASCILDGNIIPGGYTIIRMLISRLPVVNFGETSMIEEILQKKLLDKMGLLKDKEIEDFYYGKNPELLSIFNQMLNEVMILEPVFKKAQEEEQQAHHDQIFNEIQNTEHVDDMATIVNGSTPQTQHNEELQADDFKLRSLESMLDSIIELYGTADVKIKYKKQSKMDTIELKMFLLNIEQNIPKVNMDPMVVSTLYQDLSILAQNIPTDILDPFTIDSMNNLYMVFCNPKDYYSYCKKEEIDSAMIGEAFYTAFPEFHSLFVDMYMEDYESMDYQEQTNFRKCFALTENNGDLVSFCSSGIHPATPPAQGK